MLTMTFLTGPRKGSKIAVRPGEMTLGRGEGCSVIIPDTKVSRVHCTLHLDGDRLWIEDHGSLNGITVNGKKVETVDLKRGDTVRMGDTVFIITTAESEIQLLATGKTIYRVEEKAAEGPVVAEVDEERARSHSDDSSRKHRHGGWWPRRHR